MKDFREYLFREGSHPQGERDTLSFHQKNARAYQNITQALREINLAPFWGAGLTTPSYPLWYNLLQEFASERKLSIDKKLKAEELASDLIKRGGERNFGAFLSRRFATPPQLTLQRRRILEIFPHFHVTTNFDTTIESLRKPQLKVILPHELEVGAIQTNEPCIVKVHGDISDLDNIILSEESYEQFYSKEKKSDVQRALFRLLSAKIILFIGCSLVEDRTMDIIEQCAQQGCQFYALLPLPESTQNSKEPYRPHLTGAAGADIEAREAQLRQLNITPLWYPHGEHDCVDELLDMLYEIVHPTPAPPIHILKPQQYVGRIAELAELQETIQAGEHIPYISGAPGIGKTQLCLQALQRLLDAGAIQRYLRIDCQHLSSLEQLYRDAITEGRGDADAIAGLTPVQQGELAARALLDYAEGGRLIIFLDNFDALNKQACEQRFLEPLLAWLEQLRRARLDLLIASRYDELRCEGYDILDSPIADDCHSILIGKLSREESHQLFRTIVPASKWIKEDETYEIILTRLDGHPQAIKIIAGIAKLQSSWGALLARIPEITHATPLTLSCQAAWNLLTEASRLLWGIMVYSIAPLPRRWFESKEDFRWNDALIELRDLSLIELREADLSMLIPVQEEFARLTRDQRACRRARDQWWMDQLASLLAVDELTNPELVSYQAQALHVLGELVRQDEDEDTEMLVSLSRGMENYYQHDWSVARQYLDQLFPFIIRRKQSALHASTLRQQSHYERFHDQHDASLETLEQARTLYAQQEDQHGLANTLQSKGYVYRMKDMHDDALEAYQQAEELYLAVGSRLGLANTLQSKGDVYRMKAQHDVALEVYQQAEELYLAVGDRLGLANTLTSKGDVYRMKDMHDVALEAYQQAEELFLAVGSRLGLANTLKSKGDVYRMKAQHDVALEAYQQAEELFLAVGSRLGLANTLKSKGDVYSMKAQHDVALEAYQQAEELYLAVGDRLGLANTLQSKGILRLLQANPEEALQLLHQAEGIYSSIGDRYSLAHSYLCMHVACTQLGQDEEAQHYLALYESLKSELGS